MYPGFVFEFTDNITRSKTMVCCAGDLLIKHDPANYRAITLVNIMSKIFSLCLRKRINKWCENENVFS